MLSSVNFTLAIGGGRTVETMTLTGAGNINGTGNAQANALNGNAGNNVLDGGAGADTLRGNGGADSFLFRDALGASNIDTIAVFSVAADTIRLENAIFTTIAGTGTLTAGQFTANTTGLATDSAHRIVYETDTGNLFYDTNGSAAGGSVLFAVITAGLGLNNLDFLVV